MESIARRSPVVFDRPVKKRELHDHWGIVLEYDDEGPGPHLVDLSHQCRWDIQDRQLDRHQPWQSRIPQVPGRCRFENGLLITRLNRTQASVWHLAGDQPDVPADPAYTQTTDGTVFLSLFGRNVFAIAEKLSALDFLEPSRKAPFLLQGPFVHVPCQIVVMKKTTQRAGMLLTCSRGYARDMVHAILAAGHSFGLHPAGVAAFSHWIETFNIQHLLQLHQL